MSSSNVPESKRKSSQTVSFLEISNPEVFKAEPRPGGVIPTEKLAWPESRCKDEEDADKKETGTATKISVEPKVSREFRVQTALDETYSDDEIKKEPLIPNPLKDSIYMLGVAITGIILLSVGKTDMPKGQLEWTRDYLQCIRDDFGNHPPNVQGILNHINHIGGGKEAAGGESGEKTVRSVTRVRVSQAEGTDVPAAIAEEPAPEPEEADAPAPEEPTDEEDNP